MPRTVLVIVRRALLMPRIVVHQESRSGRHPAGKGSQSHRDLSSPEHTGRQSVSHTGLVSYFEPVGTNPPFDSRLLQNGAVTLFWDPAVLDEACGLLKSLDYCVVHLDAGSWHDRSAMYDDLAATLGFPAYFGRNLAALNDCISDLAAGGYNDSEAVERWAFVLTRFDTFAGVDPHAAHALADIIEYQSRSALLIGHRMLGLLQSSDPRFTLPPVGAHSVIWNPAEWLNSKRGI